MPKNFKRNEQKRAEEAKSCMKVPSRKMIRLENATQNKFKSLTNSVIQNCSEFVMLNKRENFQKLDRNSFIKIKDFGKQGFCFYYFIVLVLYISLYI